MSIDTGYSNPIDLLKLILTYQNNGDNATGEASSTARIRSGIGVNGSFDSTALDAVRSINIHCQIDDASKGSTDTLIDTICKMFNLVQYTDSEGYECVKYLFAEGSDVPIRLFTIDENVSIENFNAPDSTKICINPVIKYAYNYGLGKYTAELKIDNVQTGVFNASNVSGFQGTDGETYWNKCLTMLWPLVRHIEDMDSDWSENEFITDYAGAKFRLDNLIKLMRSCTMDFTVSFSEGCLTESGDIIEISFPHLSLTGDTVFDAVVTGITKSKASNSCTISVMFIGNSTPFELMDSSDENAFPLIDSYDPQPLQFNNSYFENDTQSPLTYIDPTARSCHITQINDSLTDLIANMDACQIGIDTDHKQLLYTDDTNGFHYMLEGNGSQNRLLKYVDNYGHVGNSIMREVSGKIGIGLDAPQGNLHVHNPDSLGNIVLSDMNTGSDHGLELSTMALTHTYDSFEFRDTPSVLYGTMAWLSKNKNKIDIGYQFYTELSPINLNGTVTLNKIASVASSNILVLDGNSSICKTGLAGIGAEPAITAGNSAQYWRGDKTWQALNTTAVAEGTNLYFTNARVVSAITSNCPDLNAIEALTGASGLLRKTAANTWSLDTTSYAPKSTLAIQRLVTWNGTALSSTTIETDNYSMFVYGSLECENLRSTGLAVNKLVFTNPYSYLTTTGIGTSAQFLKADGSLDSSVYLTGNQTITLSGVVSGSGATAITTTMADGALSIAKTTGLQAALNAKQATIRTQLFSNPLSGGTFINFATFTINSSSLTIAEYRWHLQNREIHTQKNCIVYLAIRYNNSSSYTIEFNVFNTGAFPVPAMYITSDDAITFKVWMKTESTNGYNTYFKLTEETAGNGTGTITYSSISITDASLTNIVSTAVTKNTYATMSALSTGYLTRWDGSNLINGPIYTDGANIAIGTTSMQGFGSNFLKLSQYTTIGSNNSTYGLIAGNCYYNQAWYPISDGAATCFFSTSDGAFVWRSNTGLVTGTAFTSTDIMGLSATGRLSIASHLSATTASFSNLSIGYLPYKNSSGYLANSLIYTNGANVSIGNTSLSEKLDVTGNIKASGYLLSDAWASPTYGGGWYMSDTTWIRSYGNKSIYHNTGVLRTDGTLQVGPNGATMNVVYGGDATFGCNVSITGNIISNNIKTVYGACFTSWNQSQSCAISSSGTYVTLNQNFYAGPLNGVTHANGVLTLQAAGTYKISFNLFASSTNGGQLVIQLCDTATSEGTQIYVTQAVDAGGSVTISAEILKTTVASDAYYLKITNGTRADTIAVCMVNLHVERLSY